MSGGQSPRGAPKPSAKNRFPSGRSGNPRGRPKGSKNVTTIVRKIAWEKHKVKEGGKTAYLSTVELLLQILLRKAMDGNVQAARMAERLRERYTSVVSEEAGYLVVPEELSVEEWMRRAEIRNKYPAPPDAYQ